MSPVQLEELLLLSERLQSALTSLSEEKRVLEKSLRDEVAGSRELAAERNGALSLSLSHTHTHTHTHTLTLIHAHTLT